METALDLFISYNHNDRSWAEWIAWTLEEKGYTTIIQAWDFPPGSNFALEMKKGLNRARRMVAVLSANYLSSKFAQAEWAAFFAQDPTGEKRILVPVRVAVVDLSPLDASIVYIDLVGKSENECKSDLLRGIGGNGDGEDVRPLKPQIKPSFPGVRKPAFPGSPGTASVASKALGSFPNKHMLLGLLLLTVVIFYLIEWQPFLQTSVEMTATPKETVRGGTKSVASKEKPTGTLTLKENHH
jgi:hypothetical protein